MLPRIEIPDVEDEQTRRALRQILDRANDIGGLAIVDGIILSAVGLTTSPVKVAHKLGRIPLGYIPIKLSANAVVFGSNLTSRFLELTASATVTADLWVF